MTGEEFAKIAMSLRTYYPQANLLPNAQAMELWYQELKDLPYSVAELAVRQWVAVNKWCPTIADIRAAAYEIGEDQISDWGEAWQTVLQAVRRYGSYNKREALESLDSLTRRVVERIGFDTICMSEEIAVERANFRMIYEKLAEKEKLKARMPANLVKRLDELNKKLIGGGNNDVY